MPNKPQNTTSDLQGISQLTVDAVKGVTKVVESLHSTISHLTPILGRPKHKTKGITGVVYKSINTVADLIGKGINTALDKANLAENDADGRKVSVARETIVAALNGVLGDHLDVTNNPLSITMNFKLNGKALSLQDITTLISSSQRPVTVMIHGLCMSDVQWCRDGHDHGQQVAKDLNHTVVYLHYNTGLHISENGQQLSHLFNAIESINKQSVILNIVAHSMGGLLIRSACYYAEQLGHQWLKQLNQVVFLGTPHHGALLAKGGHWADVLLQISPYSAPFAKITTVRSNGMTDLRHGYISDQDWQKSVQDEKAKKVVQLPKNVCCYAIATSRIDKHPSPIKRDIVGDGLVTINSALGQHKDRDLGIPDSRQWIGTNINHMQLLSDQGVYAVIKQWLT